MFVRLTVASLFLAGVSAFAAPVTAAADEPLCKPGHVLDASRQLCYDPSTAYQPNVPAQQPFLGSIFGGSSSNAPAASNSGGAPAAATAPGAPPSSSGGGFFGWLSDQARFCRYGDRQVGNGDSAYCVARNGKTYPAGR